MVCSGQETGDSRRGNAEKRREERQLRKRDGITMIAWNVAGVKNKNIEFWNFVGSFDYVMLMET